MPEPRVREPVNVIGFVPAPHVPVNPVKSMLWTTKAGNPELSIIKVPFPVAKMSLNVMVEVPAVKWAVPETENSRSL